MRRIGLYIPLVIIYLVALLVLLDFFTQGLVDGVGRLLALWVSIITAFLLLLGLFNILRVHLGRIRSRHPSAPYSAVLLVSVVVVLVVGVIGHNQGYQNWIFQYVYQPLTTTMFSLLAFLMISAAVRALRIGTVESTLLVIGALIVLVGQVAISPISGLAGLTQWFLDYPVLGVIRGILIGTALGAIATSLRYLLGVDNSYLR
ncbi:MAG TPA: hypothetical protein VH186_24665 [Chloroflexia bacterium]|nr:hypothetical protein [Chloroflexia bacterium]